MRFFGPLYDRVIEWSRHRYAERYLAAMSFAESSFFPVPVDVMLAPMCLASRARAWRYAAIAALFSVIGGLGGYAIGFWAFDLVQPWLAESRFWSDYQTSRDWLDRYGIWVIFIAGFSPLPYKVVFIIGSAIGRGARFFLVAGLVVLGGDKLETTLRKHVERIGWIVSVIIVVAIAVWLLVRG
ncbi:MAG: DedA family protein [Woeseiaceae bacterium]